MAVPAAMQPKKTISEIARPRARTQLGSAVWAETLRLVSTVIQPRPQRTAPGRAEAVLVASPSAAIAAATATVPAAARRFASAFGRSEEHTSELQSLMRNSYAVFCLK